MYIKAVLRYNGHMSPIIRMLHPHIRKMSVHTDLRQVADLIELCFGYQMDHDGKQYLKYLRNVAAGRRQVRWVDGANERISVPLFGYVWIEDGKLVGNVSISPFAWQKNWYYLIANVAVHPDYRRRGIAKLLTEQAVYHAQFQGVDHLWLQVKEFNQTAIRLYQNLGFEQRAVRTQWRLMDYVQIGEQSEKRSSMHVIPRPRKDWERHQEWFEKNYPLDVQWYFGVDTQDLAPGLLKSVERYLLNDQAMHHYSAYNNNQLAGIMTYQPTQNNPHSLYLSIPVSETENEILESLLGFANRLFGISNTLRVNYPAGRGLEAFQACNFLPQNTLIWMEYPTTLFKKL